MPNPLNAPAWSLLQAHYAKVRERHMTKMFVADPDRAQRFALTACGIFCDYSKHRIDDETLRLLFALAREQGVPQRIAAMFAGEKINATEERAALHTALRADDTAVITVDGVDVMPAVRDMRERVENFCRRVREGTWTGYTGKAITDVVNLGIGGSDLGPRMACEALARYGHERLTRHFVSNVDGAHLARVLQRVRPETTLFIVASKTFTTQETLTNARAARQWLLATTPSINAVGRHFVAVSTNTHAVTEFGIDADNMFEFWDWVGGRYSLWSAIGLSIGLAIGPERYREFLAGARAMDEHFRSAPLERNMPAILALLGVWYTNFFGSAAHLLAPYNQALSGLPAYLQQLEMESNGKAVTLTGERVDYSTCPIVWGETAINGQHAFFQLLHQGTHLVPVDFIAALENAESPDDAQAILIANCLAQAEALMRGKSASEVEAELRAQGMAEDRLRTLVPHKLFAGNRPSTTLLLDRLDPYTLGALIALYEHKVLVQGTIWNLNPFDQWGVELGKQLASHVLAELQGKPADSVHDASTTRLVAHAAKALRRAQ